jgi:hypothetical protein
MTTDSTTTPAPAAPSLLDTWATGAKGLARVVYETRDLARGVLAPPAPEPGEDPSRRVAVLLDLLKALRVIDPAGKESPADAARRKATDALAGAADVIGRDVALLVHNADRQLAAALAAGGRHDGLVSHADLGGRVKVLRWTGEVQSPAGGPVVKDVYYSMAAWADLRPDHPLCSKLKAEDCYNGTDLVLGPVLAGDEWTGVEHRQYWLADAVEANTLAWGREQRRLREHEEQLERHRKAEAKARWDATNEGRIARLEEELRQAHQRLDELGASAEPAGAR